MTMGRIKSRTVELWCSHATCCAVQGKREWDKDNWRDADPQDTHDCDRFETWQTRRIVLCSGVWCLDEHTEHLRSQNPRVILTIMSQVFLSLFWSASGTLVFTDGLIDAICHWEPVMCVEWNIFSLIILNKLDTHKYQDGVCLFASGHQ